MEETNILGRIPGEYVARAGQALPDARTSKQKEMHATVQVPGHGAIVITFELMSRKRARTTHIWWCPKHARPAD